MRRPPDDAHHHQQEGLEARKHRGHQRHRTPESEAVALGQLAADLHAHARDQHDPEDEPEQDPAEPVQHRALVPGVEQEEHQAADHDHDQRRLDGGDEVIDQRATGSGAGHRGRLRQISKGRHELKLAETVELLLVG